MRAGHVRFLRKLYACARSLARSFRHALVIYTRPCLQIGRSEYTLYAHNQPYYYAGPFDLYIDPFPLFPSFPSLESIQRFSRNL